MKFPGELQNGLGNNPFNFERDWNYCLEPGRFHTVFLVVLFFGHTSFTPH